MSFSFLSRLIRPVNPQTFFQDRWGKAACLFTDSFGAEAGEILSLEAFERLLATLNRAHEGWLHFARGCLKKVPPDMVDQAGMLDMRKIRAALTSGETLYLTKAERLSPSLMHLCRDLELELMARGIGLRESVNAHVFLTPPDSQGFAPHRDEHASFVLQLDGAKEWTVYDPMEVTEGILRAGGVDPARLRLVKNRTYHLQVGDVLYIPEWWPHEARACSRHSFHVTIRIFPLRWIDLMLELCVVHPALSEALPREATTNPQQISEALNGLLGSKPFVDRLPKLLDEIVRCKTVPRTALPADGFRQALALQQIELDTLLVRSAGTTCVIFATDGEVRLQFPGGSMRGPAALHKVFDYVVRTTSFRPRDLPAVTGHTYDRLTVARAMVREGLLRIPNLADNVTEGGTVRGPRRKRGKKNAPVLKRERIKVLATRGGGEKKILRSAGEFNE
jgi:hypothetical protein